MSDQIILFLDFDGVLHAPNCRDAFLFEHLARLEAVLYDFPAVSIVVSSSWRERRSLDQLRTPFAVEMQERVIGSTPLLRFQRELPHRGLECTTWMAQNAPDLGWLAIDDEPSLFGPHQPVLVCDSRLGFDDKRSAELRAKLLKLDLPPAVTSRSL